PPHPPQSPLFPYTTLFRSAKSGPPDRGRIVTHFTDSFGAHRIACRTDDPLSAPGLHDSHALFFDEGSAVMTSQLWRRILGGSKVDRKSTRLNSSHVSISYA